MLHQEPTHSAGICIVLWCLFCVVELWVRGKILGLLFLRSCMIDQTDLMDSQKTNER